MSSTNKTTYYELPQFVDSDLFNPLVDDNDAYSKIDTALHQIAEAEAGDASEIVGVKGRVTTAEGKITALETQNGNEVLTTTAQTLSGAINELDADVASLDDRLDVVEDDINNANTGLKAKVTALETQNGNEALETTAQTLSGAVNELNADLISAFVTPQMFGAKGDGVTNDTSAFIALSNENGNIFIPKGVYVINEEVTIANVISDNGTYTNYEPLYKKKLELPLDKLSIINKGVALNAITDYEESICKIGNRYYVIVNEETDDNNGIMVYDEDFALVSHVASTKTTVGTCNSCCTDGVYLYIDYDNGYHRKYNPANLTTPMLEVNTNYRNTCYYNKSLYAVNITSNQISVSKLDNTMSVLSDTWTIDNTSDVLQSATIFKGVLYIPTTIGNIKAVDLVSHEMLSVQYNDQPIEIEAFFDNDGELCVIGHVAGMNGSFNISAFNGGISYVDTKYIEIDATVNKVTIGSTDRTGFYHIVNGKTADVLPSDDGILSIMGAHILYFSVTDNVIFARHEGTWRRYGIFREINKLVSFTGMSGNLVLTLTRDLNLLVSTNNLIITATNASYKVVESIIDISDMFELAGWENGKTFTNYVIAHESGELFGDIYAVRINIEKTVARVNVTRIVGSGTNVNARINTCVPMRF